MLTSSKVDKQTKEAIARVLDQRQPPEFDDDSDDDSDDHKPMVKQTLPKKATPDEEPVVKQPPEQIEAEHALGDSYIETSLVPINDSKGMNVEG